MVAKDYPFYLTVKRANCSLEAPLGSGAAKDEVGRAPPGSSAALPWVPLAFFPSPLRAAFLQIATARLFSGVPSPCARELRLLAAASEPQVLSRAGKDTYLPLHCQEGPGVSKEPVSKAMSPLPSRDWESLKFLEIGSEDRADTLGFAAV